jgi:hypothetical protein
MFRKSSAPPEYKSEAPEVSGTRRTSYIRDTTFQTTDNLQPVVDIVKD